MASTAKKKLQYPVLLQCYGCRVYFISFTVYGQHLIRTVVTSHVQSNVLTRLATTNRAHVSIRVPKNFRPGMGLGRG